MPPNFHPITANAVKNRLFRKSTRSSPFPDRSKNSSPPISLAENLIGPILKKSSTVGFAGIGRGIIIGYGIYVGGMGCALFLPCPVGSRMDNFDGMEPTVVERLERPIQRIFGLKEVRSMKKSLKLAGVSSFVALLGLCATPRLFAETLTVGGWAMTFPDSTTSTSWIGLTDVTTSGSTLNIGEKDAVFDVNEPLPIVFQKETSSADSTIVIQTEAIVNDSGSTWSSFNFSLVGNATFAGAGDTFAPPAQYSGFTFSPSEITYTGSQANGDVSFWGLNGDGDLVINADGASTFFFKEFPNGGGNTPVSLPAGVWQGLSGLGGLGLVVAAKKFRRQAV
jgi:hypothetical protein